MIALDVFGGDHAPITILRGALRAADKGVPVALCGDEKQMLTLLFQLRADWASLPLVLVQADQVIAMDDDPVVAVKSKPRSSMAIACRLVADGKAGGVVSAGNSGALMVASLFLLGREEGIERPAIAGLLPSCSGRVIGLDLGANTECRPHHLEQFAFLGNRYAQHLFGITSPRIALLANGHEDNKGSQLTKTTFQLLKHSGLNFIGNCEPDGLLLDKTDVIVCDGFSGNIMLKTMEAVSSLHACQCRPVATNIKSAVLLGVRGNVVVCHGNADEQAIDEALVHAYQRLQPEKGNVSRVLFSSL